MKHVIIFHAMGATPESYWYPYIKNVLEKKGYTVAIPRLPNTDKADKAEWLPVALKEKFDEETIVIGHSAGCPLILSILERIHVKIKQAVLIAGFFEPLAIPEPILQDHYDWPQIKEHCADFIFINADNDPWGCDEKTGRKLLDHVGGKLIIPKGEGHMGSDKFHQPYKEFPFLLKLID